MGQLARGLALAVSLAAGAKDYMARVDPSLRTWTRSIRIAHDSFLDLELHRGQLRAFQGGQLFELPYAAARVDPDCPVNNENHLERTIVERMLQMILPWSYCWKCSSGRSCGEVQKRQGAVVQDSAQKKAEPEVCEDDNKNMVWLQGAWLHSQDMFWVSGLEPSPWVQVFCLHGLLPTLCAAGEKVLPLILCALYGRRWRFQCGAGWGEGELVCASPGGWLWHEPLRSAPWSCEGANAQSRRVLPLGAHCATVHLHFSQLPSCSSVRSQRA
ncbi:unnamed protein product [Effrenium voratum]|nr:unnamed protein product [Effrenium voratum]